MKYFLSFIIITILTLPKVQAQTEVMQTSCIEYPSIQIEMNSYALRIQISDREFDIPLEEGLFSVFMKEYQGERDLYAYFRNGSRSLDENYSYDLTILDTDQTDNQSLKVVIESLQKTEAKNWYNKYLGQFLNYESLPYKKYEISMVLKKTGDLSQMFMKSFGISSDHSELIQTSDLTCVINKNLN